MWPHRRGRSSPFREWWAAFRCYMGQMFGKTCYQMNNGRWGNPSAFRDHVDRSDPQPTISGKIIHTGEHFSWYGTDDPGTKIQLPSSRQYKPGNFLAVRPPNWEENTDKDADDENWADTAEPSSWRRRSSDCNDNINGEREEGMLGGEKGTGKGKGPKDG